MGADSTLPVVRLTAQFIAERHALSAQDVDHALWSVAQFLAAGLAVHAAYGRVRLKGRQDQVHRGPAHRMPVTFRDALNLASLRIALTAFDRCM